MSENRDERNTKLMELWNDGKTGKELSEIFGMPVNSVYRNINSLRQKGFALRINVTYAKAQKSRRERESLSKVPRKPKTPKARPAPLPDTPDTVLEPTKRLRRSLLLEPPETPESLLREKLYRLKESSCRWIEGNVAPYDFPCQELAVTGGSYCETHMQRIYTGRKAYP